MAKQRFIIEYAETDAKGNWVVVRRPFVEFPDGVKDILFPQWDHPDDCECHPCWQRKENTING